MKPKEIRDLGRDALDEKMLEMKKELVKINAQVAIGAALKSPGQAGKIKKAIARILTITSQKDIGKIKKQEDDKKA